MATLTGDRHCPDARASPPPHPVPFPRHHCPCAPQAGARHGGTPGPLHPERSPRSGHPRASISVSLLYLSAQATKLTLRLDCWRDRPSYLFMNSRVTLNLHGKFSICTIPRFQGGFSVLVLEGLVISTQHLNSDRLNFCPLRKPSPSGEPSVV